MDFPRQRLVSACIALTVLAIAPNLRAETAPPALSLEQVVARVAEQHPALRGHPLSLEAARARQRQAASRANPAVLLEAENFAGTGAARGVNALETTLSLSQVIDLGGERAARGAEAGARAELLAADQAGERLDVLGETAQAYIALVAAQEKFVLAQHSEALAEANRQATATRVKAGRLSEADLGRASIAAARARLESERARQRLEAARSALGTLWGQPGSRESASAALFELPTLLPVDSLLTAIAASPGLQRSVAATRLRAAELQLARAESRIAPEVSAGVRRFEETSDTALVAGVALPLRLFDRNQGAIAAAEAENSRSQIEQQAAAVRMESVLRALHSQLQLALTEAAVLRDELIPQAERTLQAIDDGYARGRFAYLDLVAAQRELLEVRGAAIDAAADAHRLVSELERLTGHAAVTARKNPS